MTKDLFLEVTVKIPLRKLTGISKKVLLEQIDIDTFDQNLGDYLPIIRSNSSTEDYFKYFKKNYFDLEKSEILSKQIKES